MNKKYYRWLIGKVSDKYHSQYYNKLFEALYEREFTWTIARDENRAIDGRHLRKRYAEERHIYDSDKLYSMDGPCSVLEMMVALSMRCEEDIMGDPQLGDRSGDWFWDMIINLKLYSNDDNNFDPDYVSERLDILLNRDYEPNGDGGLFKFEKPKTDMRTVEIWFQLLSYLNTI